MGHGRIFPCVFAAPSLFPFSLCLWVRWDLSSFIATHSSHSRFKKRTLLGSMDVSRTYSGFPLPATARPLCPRSYLLSTAFIFTTPAKRLPGGPDGRLVRVRAHVRPSLIVHCGPPTPLSELSPLLILTLSCCSFLTPSCFSERPWRALPRAALPQLTPCTSKSHLKASQFHTVSPDRAVCSRPMSSACPHVPLAC